MRHLSAGLDIPASHDRASCKMTELIQMLFGGQTRVGPRNHAVSWQLIGRWHHLVNTVERPALDCDAAFSSDHFGHLLYSVQSLIGLGWAGKGSFSSDLLRGRRRTLHVLWGCFRLSVHTASVKRLCCTALRSSAMTTGGVFLHA